MKRDRKRKTRGFTLLELCTVVAIVGVLAAVIVPSFDRVKRKNELNDLSRRTLGDLRQARALSASGRVLSDDTASRGGSPAASPPGGGGGSSAASISAPSGPGAGDIRVRFGGIRVASTTSYTIFGDDDNIAGNGGERDIAAVDFLARNAGSSIRIIAPAPGSEIRFASNGTRSSPTDLLIIEDASTGARKAINISSAGLAKFIAR